MVPVPVIDDAMLILDTCEPDEEFVFMDGSDITLEVDPDESIPVTQPFADHQDHQAQDAQDNHAQDAQEADQDDQQEEDELPIQTPPLRGKFVPFQGKGYVLGGR